MAYGTTWNVALVAGLLANALVACTKGSLASHASADASGGIEPSEPRADWGLVARHEGFISVGQVAGATVLLGDSKVRVLDRDLVRGHDIFETQPSFSIQDMGGFCKPSDDRCIGGAVFDSVLGTVGDALLLRTNNVPGGTGTTGVLAVHVPSGAHEIYTGDRSTMVPWNDGRVGERVIGATRFRAGCKEAVRRTCFGYGGSTIVVPEACGIEARDAKSDRPLWRATSSLPVLSGGVLVASIRDRGLVEMDPATGRVLSEIPGGLGPPTLLSVDGGDALAVVDFGPHSGPTPEVVILRRGAPKDPRFKAKVPDAESAVPGVVRVEEPDVALMCPQEKWDYRPIVPIDVQAAGRALQAVDVSACKQRNGPTGIGQVLVTYTPQGTVEKTAIDRPPYVGTSVATCIEGLFAHTAAIPHFSGAGADVAHQVGSLAVIKRFDLR